MRMKRGIMRESCDFCHRRKIKCDRAVRAAQGLTNCSHCDVRQAPCTVDHGDDIRARHKRQNPATSSIRHSEIQKDYLLEPASPSYSFEISSDNALFLDEVFNFDPSFENWGTPLLNIELQPENTAAMQDQTLAHPVRRGTQSRKDLWSICELSESTFSDALNAYFTFAAPALPVLSAEVFWADYEAGRCSDALVYAIACRGIPFMDISTKWETQQRLSRKFKDAFFSSRNESHGNVNLDDVEALALMMGFHYDPSFDTHQSYGDMESLFLSYDSLVLMTLRCQSQDMQTAANTEKLASAAQRRTLLFWHVYGLDAFDSLDRKSAPRVPDRSASSEKENSPNLEPGSYLDAILSLSMVARRINNLLCSAKTRNEGAAYNDIKVLYAQLDDWHRFSCPFFLQRSQGSSGDLCVPSLVHESSGEPSQLVQLQRSVLWALETNCYMQIESCVAEFGICSTDKPFEGEIASLEVQHMTLQIVSTGLQLASCINKQWGQDTTWSPANIIPSIVRDICAGFCNWVCIRAAHLQQKGIDMRSLSPYRGVDKGGTGGHVGGSIESYIEAARAFRHAVATSTAHKSTEGLLQSLDDRITSLEDTVAHDRES